MARTLIIGDIHGCYDELRDLLDVAAVAADDVVVSVGDLVDRGPQPLEVVDWFRARANSVVLMGNHERKHVRGVYSYAQEVARLQMGAGYAASVAWMRGLPYFYETPDIRVVHAAMVPGIPLAAQDEAILAGTTAGETKLRAHFPAGHWHDRYADAVPIAFGHHVTGATPLVREGAIYGLDTGACHGLRLTALSVPDFRIYAVAARPDPWKATARAYQVPVLRTRAWATMSWRKIEDALADREGDAGPDLARYTDALRGWVAALRALVPLLHARVPVLATEVTDVDGHPAKALLFAHARGRLTLEAIESRCPTPEATLALAAKLGVPTSTQASAPG
ncbi:MAG: metallophosphoesterase [Proteobacteria bacterium]|nr:metallophosphoesterase [Pseudomonadota bacterium]